MSFIRRINSTQPIKLEDNTILCGAGEDIISGVVIIKDTDNLAYIADIYNESHAHRTIGIALESVKKGENFIVQVSGNIINEEWNFEFNKPVYVKDGGKLTQIKPITGFVQMIGIPYTRNSIFIDIEPAILFNFYTPIIDVSKSDNMNSLNQPFIFTCNNANYDLIEWKIIGYNYTIHSGSLSGTISNSNRLIVSWREFGDFGVKVRIRNPVTQIFSAWSNLITATVK